MSTNTASTQFTKNIMTTIIGTVIGGLVVYWITQTSHSPKPYISHDYYSVPLGIINAHPTFEDYISDYFQDKELSSPASSRMLELNQIQKNHALRTKHLVFHQYEIENRTNKYIDLKIENQNLEAFTVQGKLSAQSSTSLSLSPEQIVIVYGLDTSSSIGISTYFGPPDGLTFSIDGTALNSHSDRIHEHGGAASLVRFFNKHQLLLFMMSFLSVGLLCIFIIALIVDNYRKSQEEETSAAEIAKLAIKQEAE